MGLRNAPPQIIEQLQEGAKRKRKVKETKVEIDEVHDAI